MNFNIFKERSCNTVQDFFNALIDAIDKSFQNASDLLNYLQKIQDTYQGDEKRIISIGIDITHALLCDTPENKHIAFVSVDAWSKGFPNPWETI